jgi:opacity protein-like surface antigen
MKTKKILLVITLSIIGCKIYAQTDSVKTSTTVTTTTTTGNTTSMGTPAPAPETEPQQRDRSDDGDLAKFYIGARFMPTFTKFDVVTLDNGTAKTSFVVGYGVGGLLGFNFTKNTGLQLEVIYSSLSQKFTDRAEERKINLSYIHIPLLLVLNTDASKPVNLNIAFGPQFGINTGSSVDADGSGGVDTVQAVVAVKPADFGLAYGAGLDFKLSPALSLDLGFRGVYGILDISDNNKTKTTNQYYILDRSHVKTYAGYAGLRLLF